ncbi:hypothetical protein LZ30DRAFT_723401 [Colletotrichum cereale]|nr:hypothetical protein LZ30DRAFT_723401 [Colletotrichum cereale]
MVLLTLLSFYMLAALSLAGSLHQPGQGAIQARGTHITLAYGHLASAVRYSSRNVQLVDDGWYVQSLHIREHKPIAEQWGLIVGYVNISTTRNMFRRKSSTLDYKAKLYSVGWVPPKGEIPGEGIEPPKWETPGHWVWGSQPWEGPWDPNTEIFFLGGSTAARADPERLKRASESWVQRAGDRRHYHDAKSPDRIPIDQLPFNKKGYIQYMARILDKKNNDEFEGTPTQPPAPTRTRRVQWEPTRVPEAS